MIVLTLKQLLELHALVMQTTGGNGRLRDLGRLEAAIATQTQNVFGGELYPDIADKSGALIHGIIADHAFVNGNKRTAVLAGITLLIVNGYEFTAKSGEIEQVAVDIATQHVDVPSISAWLKARIIIPG